MTGNAPVYQKSPVDDPTGDFCECPYNGSGLVASRSGSVSGRLPGRTTV